MIVDGVKINYGVVDNTIESDSKAIAYSSKSPYASEQSSLIAGDKARLAHLEKDWFLLDGSYVFPVASTQYNTGWESSSISDANGNINEYIEYVFANTHSSYGLSATFPDLSVPSDFTISYYSGTSLLKSVPITGNVSTTITINETVNDWNKVRITFTKVKPQQRARLYYITFGVNVDFGEDVIISFSATKTTDLSSDYFESGEMSLSFINDGSVIDIEENTDLPVELQESLRISVFIKKHGTTTYELFGNYFTQSTQLSDNGNVITLTAYDDLYELNSSVYRNGIVYPDGRSLGAWAQEVADDAGIDIEIDQSLFNIISTGYITEVPHREAFRLIAEAGRAMLEVDANGKLHIKPHIPTTRADITNDDIVENTLSYDTDERILGIDVVKYSFIVPNNAEPRELGHLNAVLLTQDIQTIEMVYSEYPVVPSSVQVFVDTTTSAVVSNILVYSDRIQFDISGTAGDQTWVTLTGKPYGQAAVDVTLGSTLRNVKKIENNYLITGSIADAVALYQYNTVAKKRQYSAEVVNDVEYTLGDKVKLSNKNIAVESIGINVEYDRHEYTIKGVEYGS